MSNETSVSRDRMAKKVPLSVVPIGGHVILTINRVKVTGRKLDNGMVRPFNYTSSPYIMVPRGMMCTWVFDNPGKEGA